MIFYHVYLQYILHKIYNWCKLQTSEECHLDEIDGCLALQESVYHSIAWLFQGKLLATFPISASPEQRAPFASGPKISTAGDVLKPVHQRPGHSEMWNTIKLQLPKCKGAMIYRFAIQKAHDTYHNTESVLLFDLEPECLLIHNILSS